MKDMLTGFGFGLKTNIGIRGETAGQLPPRDEWFNRTRARQLLCNYPSGESLQVAVLHLLGATAFVSGRDSPEAFRLSATRFAQALAHYGRHQSLRVHLVCC